ncbi:MAG TPA: hypothetical protein VNW24_09170 [Stellaceae bacterium]|jgi:hypothetical protein|nr:hypothetical protein [Stellaceae bacterium]
MTGASYIGATPPVAVPPSREAAPASPPPSAPDAAPKPAAPAQTTAPPPSFPVSVQFDQDTQRFFIEAKDSTGLVVFQVPFKSAGATPGGSSETRGQRVNSKA